MIKVDADGCTCWRNVSSRGLFWLQTIKHARHLTCRWICFAYTIRNNSSSFLCPLHRHFIFIYLCCNWPKTNGSWLTGRINPHWQVYLLILYMKPSLNHVQQLIMKSFQKTHLLKQSSSQRNIFPKSVWGNVFPVNRFQETVFAKSIFIKSLS